jgi:hypothetical protein
MHLQIIATNIQTLFTQKTSNIRTPVLALPKLIAKVEAIIIDLKMKVRLMT